MRKVTILFGYEDEGFWTAITMTCEDKDIDNIVQSIPKSIVLFRDDKDRSEVFNKVKEYIRRELGEDVEIEWEYDPFIGGCPL